MRWRIVATTNGHYVLFLDGEPVGASDDLNLLLSLFGEVTGQTDHAFVS